MCRASYYKWLNRVPTELEKENEEIAQLIIEYDERTNHIYGYRRMRNMINKLNHKNYSIKRIRRIMRLLGIKSVIRQKRKKYKKVTPEIVAENILGRNFYASRPNEKWATDVTEFKIIGTNKKIYLSAIIDLYDRSIVAYEIGKRNDNKLVFDTFDKAIAANPEAKPIFHSDRGFQYTSKTFKMKLDKQEMIRSMSRVGRCIDNGVIEGFWGIVKTEMYYLNKFNTEEELKISIEKYMDFYNNERIQERFDNMSPLEVRRNALINGDIREFPIKKDKRIIKYYEQLRIKKEAVNV